VLFIHLPPVSTSRLNYLLLSIDMKESATKVVAIWGLGRPAKCTRIDIPIWCEGRKEEKRGREKKEFGGQTLEDIGARGPYIGRVEAALEGGCKFLIPHSGSRPRVIQSAQPLPHIMTPHTHLSFNCHLPRGIHLGRQESRTIV